MAQREPRTNPTVDVPSPEAPAASQPAQPPGIEASAGVLALKETLDELDKMIDAETRPEPVTIEVGGDKGEDIDSLLDFVLGGDGPELSEVEIEVPKTISELAPFEAPEAQSSLPEAAVEPLPRDVQSVPLQDTPVAPILEDPPLPPLVEPVKSAEPVVRPSEPDEMIPTVAEHFAPLRPDGDRNPTAAGSSRPQAQPVLMADGDLPAQELDELINPADSALIDEVDDALSILCGEEPPSQKPDETVDRIEDPEVPTATDLVEIPEPTLPAETSDSPNRWVGWAVAAMVLAALGGGAWLLFAPDGNVAGQPVSAVTFEKHRTTDGGPIRQAGVSLDLNDAVAEPDPISEALPTETLAVDEPEFVEAWAPPTPPQIELPLAPEEPLTARTVEPIPVTASSHRRETPQPTRKVAFEPAADPQPRKVAFEPIRENAVESPVTDPVASEYVDRSSRPATPRPPVEDRDPMLPISSGDDRQPVVEAKPIVHASAPSPEEPATIPVEIAPVVVIPAYQPPIPLERPEPVYPPRSLKRGETGTVELRVLVDERGKVVRVVVEEGIPGSPLEAAAVETMLRWTYKPARENGHPIRGWTTQRFSFAP